MFLTDGNERIAAFAGLQTKHEGFKPLPKADMLARARANNARWRARRKAKELAAAEAAKAEVPARKTLSLATPRDTVKKTTTVPRGTVEAKVIAFRTKPEPEAPKKGKGEGYVPKQQRKALKRAKAEDRQKCMVPKGEQGDMSQRRNVCHFTPAAKLALAQR